MCIYFTILLALIILSMFTKNVTAPPMAFRRSLYFHSDVAVIWAKSKGAKIYLCGALLYELTFLFMGAVRFDLSPESNHAALVALQ